MSRNVEKRQEGQRDERLAYARAYYIAHPFLNGPLG